uniref:Uncharacterized protein n=1 Tax=Glossina pallidipes TaxID=7398 RepID=A0A1A9ZKX9_GLOPL
MTELERKLHIEKLLLNEMNSAKQKNKLEGKERKEAAENAKGHNHNQQNKNRGIKPTTTNAVIISMDAVLQSLRKLIDDGLVHRTIVGDVFVSSSSTKRHSIKSHKSSFSQLDPNRPRTECVSEESLSGDEFERTRKRLRSNNRKVLYSGRPVPLPKKREHVRKVNERANALIKSMDPANDFILID